MTSNAEPWQRLAGAIVEQAILDYQLCERCGVIVDGQVNGRHECFKPVQSNQRGVIAILKLPKCEACVDLGLSGAQRLLNFFRRKRCLESVLRIGLIDVSANLIRRALKIGPANEEVLQNPKEIAAEAIQKGWLRKGKSLTDLQVNRLKCRDAKRRYRLRLKSK